MAYKEIPLTQGFVTIVDEADYDWLLNWPWKWHYHNRGYVQDSRGRLMHRIILNPEPHQVTDHINHNKLDNRRENLRICLQSDNVKNTKGRAIRISKYKGVHLQRKNKKWVASININKKRKHLGCFSSQEDAANAYNLAAIEYFGEFAHLNQIEAAMETVDPAELKAE